ncbi:MAG TPA: AraC family transcriptional regulator [Flavilitoribacter sp.]|nr:AraC family transcriptional regulator [Flavilitoribacter sp.]HMQ86907.1 AraC family transcriptional regulator [Flavilitoribacter sp.]
MILQKLPDPNHPNNRDAVPVLHDHVLFADRVINRYECPEHASAFGLMTLQKGCGRLVINQAPYDLDAVTCMPVNSGSRLSFSLPEKDTAPAFLFFDSALPGAIHRSLVQSHAQLLDCPEPDQNPDFSLLEYRSNKDADLEQSLRLLIRLGKSCSSFSALKADAVVRGLLERWVVKNADALQLSARLEVVKPATRNELFRRLSAAREWIEAHCEAHISLNQMAGVAAMNSQHFLRLFKQVFGATPYRYLIDLRLDRARERIENSDQPVSDICKDLGYESLSTFSGLFRRRFGIPPNQLRIL